MTHEIYARAQKKHTKKTENVQGGGLWRLSSAKLKIKQDMVWIVNSCEKKTTKQFKQFYLGINIPAVVPLVIKSLSITKEKLIYSIVLRLFQVNPTKNIIQR